MQKRIVAVIIVGIVAVAIGWIAFGRLYYLRDDSGGQLLWKNDECYLFAHVARRGYRIKVLEYPARVLTGWLGVVPIPSDQRVFLTVIRVTPSGIERHDLSVGEETWEIPAFFTPVGATIYANCHGTLCKWVDGHFENTTAEDKKNLDGIYHLPPEVDGPINGWYKRGVGSVVGDIHFSIDIGNATRLRIQEGNVSRSVTDSATVYLDRVDQPSQQLWHVSGDPRRVGRREYEKALVNR
jgi:hypothetical protein